MAAALKKTLQEMIECSICLNPMVNPRLLSCQHSFCAKCLLDLSLHNGTPKKFVVCPTCRSYTAMPGKGVYDLPPDFTANTLASLVNESESSEDSPNNFEHEQEPKCAVCNKNEQAYRVKMFCKQCKDFMCSGCAANHKITSIFSSHELVEVTQNVCKWESEKCPEHPQKAQEYFCEDCKVLVCSACVTNKHRNHNVHIYVEYLKNQQKEIKRKRGTLETVYSDSFMFNANRAKMENYSAAINQRMTEIQRDVEESAARAIAEVEKEKAQLLSSIEEHRMDFNQRFKDAQPHQLEADVYTIFKDCESYLKTKKPAELLNDFQPLSLKMEATTKAIEENHEKASTFLSTCIPSRLIDTDQRVKIGDIIWVGVSKSFPEPQLAQQFLTSS